MMLLGMAGLVGLVFLFLFARGMQEEWRNKKEKARRIHESYGKAPEAYIRAKKSGASIVRTEAKRPEDEARYSLPKRPDGYLQTCRETEEKTFFVDEITWKDLDMERIFARLNYTASSAGEEYLYAWLHKPQFSEEGWAEWEEIAAYLAQQEGEREALQSLFEDIGESGRLSLYDCLKRMNGMKEGFGDLREYAGNLLYVAAAGLFFFQEAYGLMLLTAAAVYQVVTYYRERSRILPYISGIAYLLRMVEGAERVASLKRKETDVFRACMALEKRQKKIRDCCGRLRSLRKHSYWVLQSGKISGSPLDMAGDYVRMLFHPDIIQFHRLCRRYAEYEKEICSLAEHMGYLEAVLSTVLYRASLESWCLPEESEALCMQGMYHPLLEHPVKNDIMGIAAFKGVLITGSNASGKTTFLKTTAVNLLLSQTIHTVLADKCARPYMRLYTSLAAADSLERGESYYVAEIRALKRIVDAVAEEAASGLAPESAGQPAPAVCFLDEVLRGTNTVERIAASCQILKGLSAGGACCFAATHDIELTELLAGAYENYHFEEDIVNGDLSFSYRLRKGKAESRNAIRLLAQMGFDEELVQEAQKLAEHFMEKGEWTWR